MCAGHGAVLADERYSVDNELPYIPSSHQFYKLEDVDLFSAEISKANPGL